MRRGVLRMSVASRVSIPVIGIAHIVAGTPAALMRADVVARVVVMPIVMICGVVVGGAPLLAAVVRRSNARSPERERGRR